MEQFDASTLQPPIQLPNAIDLGTVPNNPSTLTLAMIGIGTFVLLGLGRRSLTRTTSVGLAEPTAKPQAAERQAA